MNTYTSERIVEPELELLLKDRFEFDWPDISWLGLDEVPNDWKLSLSRLSIFPSLDDMVDEREETVLLDVNISCRGTNDFFVFICTQIVTIIMIYKKRNNNKSQLHINML